MVKDGIYLSERYEVISKLGAGGMADVYKGRDCMLNRYVAIKVLKKEYREDENFVRKFRSEAQAAAGLLHPNIVNVYDVGEDRGLYYMVMELVEGITLKEYIQKKGKLTSRETINIAIQMCMGIEAAHKHNIVHRDIKPQNIIISKEGKVKVTDFGIARATTSQTTSSGAMGSVHYVSPEQARGGYCDGKSDIYSAGITMYEMVTGQVPFDGETTVSVAMKHLQERITPPSTYVKDMSRALEDIILKCTQKSPERRYATAALLIQDLKHALVDPDGNFVTMIPFRTEGATVIISDDEIDQIKDDYDTGRMYDDDDYDDDDYDDDDYDDRYDDNDDYDDDDDDKEDGSSKKSEVNPNMNKMMKILTIVAAVLIAFVLIFIIGKAAGVFKFGPGHSIEETIDKDSRKKVEVPKLVGEKLEVAEKICEKKNLELKVVEYKNSDDYAAGQIMEQYTPAGDKVKAKSVIEVVVSSGKAELEVEDVSGNNEDDAWKVLKSVGFKKHKVEFEYSSEYENGLVINTIPAAGEKASSDTEIILVVSKGTEKKAVPNLKGKTASEAASALTAAGFVDGGVSEERYSDDVAAGKVMEQSETSGKKVDTGTSISYVISLGSDKVEVPSIEIGGSLSAAQSALSNAGLNYEYKYVDSDIAVGNVYSVSPGVGTRVKIGSTVTITISNGPKQVEPDPTPNPTPDTTPEATPEKVE